MQQTSSYHVLAKTELTNRMQNMGLSDIKTPLFLLKSPCLSGVHMHAFLLNPAS